MVPDVGYQYGSAVPPAREADLRVHPVMDGWVSGPENVEEGGLSTVVGKLSNPWGQLFKTSCPVGDEVPRPRRPALVPPVSPVDGSSWSLEPTYFNQ